MISRVLHLRGWTLVFYFATQPPEPERVLQTLKAAGAQSEINRAAQILESAERNCGFTYTNPETQTAVTYIGPTTSAAQFLNTCSHELRHISDAVTAADHGEPPAYLTGDICERLSDIICRFSCEKCRKNL